MEHFDRSLPSDRALLLQADGIEKTFPQKDGSRMRAIAGLTLTVSAGEFVSIVGPSGAGKTTLLRCLSGLLDFDAGSVRHLGHPVRGVPDDLGLVFQDYSRSLLPWLTISKNVGLGLSRKERAARVPSALARVGLGEYADMHPWQLSGGMQQRAAIARAVASRPSLLLMDEPFASVDAQTRESLEVMTLSICAEFALGCLLVTHDIDEAIFMADRVLVLSERPTRVIEEIIIDLPRPRSHFETPGLPRFQEYRQRVRSLIKSRPTAVGEVDTPTSGCSGPDLPVIPELIAESTDTRGFSHE